MSAPSDSVRVSYDEESDVLYVSLGAPRPAYGMPDDDMDSLVLRRDFDTHDVVGFTVIGLKKLDLEKLTARIPFFVDFARYVH